MRSSERSGVVRFVARLVLVAALLFSSAATLVRAQDDEPEFDLPELEDYSGLRASSDRLRELDEWGLETTRRLLRRGLTTPFVP